ncbi:hypothetical protein BD779DRAFT_1478739 [Infundibulicybe gibba]|nr:hypothetical protein BD779DRAFT_1478739 [Infundibulicybe gibba]
MSGSEDVIRMFQPSNPLYREESAGRGQSPGIEPDAEREDPIRVARDDGNRDAFPSSPPSTPSSQAFNLPSARAINRIKDFVEQFRDGQISKMRVLVCILECLDTEGEDVDGSKHRCYLEYARTIDLIEERGKIAEQRGRAAGPGLVGDIGYQAHQANTSPSQEIKCRFFRIRAGTPPKKEKTPLPA